VGPVEPDWQFEPELGPPGTGRTPKVEPDDK
jgi:hypothetical protein